MTFSVKAATARRLPAKINKHFIIFKNKHICTYIRMTYTLEPERVGLKIMMIYGAI